MQTLRVPSLPAVDTVVLGGTLKGIVCALRQADAGHDVMLIEQGVCLYREMDQAADYAIPIRNGDPWIARLFPPGCLAAPGLAHPDRLKRHGEALCDQARIRLLYAAQALSWHEGRLLVAHKAGLFAVACQRLFDLREAAEPLPVSPRYFALHVLQAPTPLPGPFCMEERIHDDLRIPGDMPLHLKAGPAGDGHAVLYIPVLGSADERSPKGRYAMYELALCAFRVLKQRPGCGAVTLARSGFACLPAQGIDIEASIRRGLAATEGWALGDTNGSKIPLGPLFHANPLYPHRRPFAFPIAAPDIWKGDVVVVGGGTAGALAAYGAAKQGLRVRLLEMNEMLGGTATCGGVSIYWFGTRDGATALVDARVDALYRSLNLPRSRCLWNEHDVFLPDLKAHALLSLCLEAGVEIVFQATSCAVTMEDAHRVTGVAFARGGQLCLANAPMVIDATGDADIAMFARARHTYGGDENALTYWGSLAQYTSPASYRNNFSTMVHVGDPLDYTRFILAGRRRGGNLYDHGRYVALRESRHIQGMKTVSLDRLLSPQASGDTLYQCFSNYDPKGKLTADLVYAGFLPPTLRMNVPRGAVIPTAADAEPIDGLLVGGKAISCTHDALPGLRMQPDLQQQGFALGILAAESIRQHVPAWAAEGVAEAIMAEGGQAILPLDGGKVWTLPECVNALTGGETLEWLDMDPSGWIDGQQPALRCFLADAAEIVPLLRAALAAPDSTRARKLLLSRLLLWHGSSMGVPCVLEAIEDMLHKTQGLPTRDGPITFGQLLPDHGLMPEIVYLLNALAWERDTPVTHVFETVLARVLHGPRDFYDLRAGLYCYVECFAYVAMRRGDTAFLPMLRALSALPELSGGDEADPLLAERYAMLRLSLAEAIARLGDTQGHAMLRALAEHPVQAIRESARMLRATLKPPPAVQPVTRRVF